MKKNKKQFEEWANKKLKKIQKLYLLEHFNLKDIRFDSEDEDNVAYCTFHYPYNTIRIVYTRKLYSEWVNGNIKDVIKTLLHEMAHPLTDELYSKGHRRFCTEQELEDAREKLTDHISNIILSNNIFN